MYPYYYLLIISSPEELDIPSPPKNCFWGKKKNETAKADNKTKTISFMMAEVKKNERNYKKLHKKSEKKKTRKK